MQRLMCLSACEGRCPPCNHITYHYVFISTMKSWQTTTQSELRLQYRTSQLNTEMILLVSCEPDTDTSCKISANSCCMSTGVTRLLSTDGTQQMLHNISCLQMLVFPLYRCYTTDVTRFMSTDATCFMSTDVTRASGCRVPGGTVQGDVITLLHHYMERKAVRRAA